MAADTSADPPRPRATATRLGHAGRDTAAQRGAVNPPVYHASTILFETLDELEAGMADKVNQVYYGRIGTPTSWAFEDAVAEIEGGHRAVVAASGQAALTTALMAFLQAGDHLLMVDTCYGPTRFFCDSTLKRFGVEVEYYDPRIGGDIRHLIRPTTRVVYVESPGSMTFEVQDVAAIAEATKAAQPRATVLMDNTWATPLYFKPFRHGVDVSIQAATKYIAGHADAMLGLIDCADAASFKRVKTQAIHLGECAGPDDIFLGLRGLRTLELRMAQHHRTGLALADWLAGHPAVKQVIHPARPDHPDHALYSRDFAGASGLFAVILQPCSRRALAALTDHMALFSMGFSWGGFESLLLPGNPAELRQAVPWREEGQLLRIHAGLEDPDELIADLSAALQRFQAADG